MKPSGRVGLLTLALALAAAACTGGSGAREPSGPTGGSEPVIRPGTSGVFRYQNAGLVATLDLHAGTLEIENGTGRELGRPGFYALDATDGHRVEGRVLDPAPIPAGETMSFQVRLDGLAPKDVGLLVLLLGGDNYGAFVQE